MKAHGLALGEVGRGNFPLPTLAPKLARWLEEIRTGRGFVVLRGLNVTDYTDEEVGLIFWALGAYLGDPVTQNPRGDLLGHVYDHGRRYGDIDVRGYETNAHLPFHSDGCDLVGLLCLRRAKSGGLSSIVSSVTLHNEILRQHPEYLPPLYNGYHYIKREAALTDDPVTANRVPVFGAKDGYVSARLVRNQINAAAPRLGKPLPTFGTGCIGFPRQPGLRPGDPSRHGPAARRYAALQQLDGVPFAHRLRGLARTGTPPPHDPALADLPRAPSTGRTFAPQNGYGRNQIAEVAFQTPRPHDRATPVRPADPASARRRRIRCVGGPHKFGGRIIHFLIQHGFPGRIVPINPRRKEILGHPAFGTLTDAPPGVEVAILAVPVSQLLPALEQCAAAGVGCCVIITTGFAEADEAGAELQQRMLDIAQPAGMRIVGPNCMGLINPGCAACAVFLDRAGHRAFDDRPHRTGQPERRADGLAVRSRGR